jgi:hypothetical protein
MLACCKKVPRMALALTAYAVVVLVLSATLQYAPLLKPEQLFTDIPAKFINPVKLLYLIVIQALTCM